MESSPFIFSNRYRLHRHLLFWLSWWIFNSILYSFTPRPVNMPLQIRFLVSAIDAVIYMVPHIFLSYTLMYFTVPKFVLKNRYALAVLQIPHLFLLTAFLSALLSVFVLEKIHDLLLPLNIALAFRHPASFSLYMSLLAGLRGAITIGGIAASIKLAKHWYIKEQRNLQLQKENAQAQLQLLKAQVHPHFLFNTLNNIYAHTQITSPVASSLVMGLSDMLRYMLYEGNRALVPLSHEINLLRNYILVEKIRYGNRLEVNLEAPEEEDELEIAPLLLLPFVENSFKHGASQVLDQPWLNLHIEINGTSMHMKIVNGKGENNNPHSEASGLGIRNVQKRLELLYPGKHTLKIRNEEEVFIVDLTLTLDRKPAATKSVFTVNKIAAYE